MKHNLEKYLWENMGTIDRYHPFPREIIQNMLDKKMINSSKQAWRTLEKWADKGLYEWGTVMDLGWKTTKTPNAPQKPTNELPKPNESIP